VSHVVAVVAVLAKMRFVQAPVAASITAWLGGIVSSLVPLALLLIVCGCSIDSNRSRSTCWTVCALMNERKRNAFHKPSFSKTRSFIKVADKRPPPQTISTPAKKWHRKGW
jgi:hypothetical protein